MSHDFLRSLEDIGEEQEAIIERELDPDFALISDYVIGELSESEAAEVRARIQRDPAFRDKAEPLLIAYEHGPRYRPMPREELERSWIQLRRRIGLPELPGMEREPKPDIDRFKAGLAKHRRKLVWTGVAVAAGFFLLLLVPPAILMYGKLKSSQLDVTPPGATQVMTLLDGSRATLSGGSRLVMLGDGVNSRGVILTGEAVFDVKHDKAAPFQVNTGAAYIVVTGTVFRVHAYQYEPTQLTVIEGSVEVRARDRFGNTMDPKLVVKAGQRALITQGLPPVLQP